MQLARRQSVTRSPLHTTARDATRATDSPAGDERTGRPCAAPRPAPDGLLEIHLFGPPRIRCNAHWAAFPTQRAFSILARLTLSAGRPISRATLIEACWGDSSEAKAKKCLNTEIWRIRRMVRSVGLDPSTFLVSDANRVVFCPDAPYWLDVQAFEDGITDAFGGASAEDLREDQVRRLEKAVALFDGDLAGGWDDAWMATYRARLVERYVLALEYLVAAFRQRDEHDRAIGYARRLLEVDPFSEAGHFEMIVCLFLKGRRCDALRQYQRCVDVLHSELGVEPMPATTWFVDVIKGSLSIEDFHARTCAAAPDDLDRRPSSAPATSLIPFRPSDDVQQALAQLRATHSLLEAIRDQLETVSRSDR